MSKPAILKLQLETIALGLVGMLKVVDGEGEHVIGALLSTAHDALLRRLVDLGQAPVGPLN